MSDPITPILGGKFAVPIAGLIGAFLSLAFVKNLKPLPSVFSVMGGAALAYYAGPAVVDYLPSASGRYEELVGFIIGFTGMNLLGGLFYLSRRFRIDPVGTAKKLRSLIKK